MWIGSVLDLPTRVREGRVRVERESEEEGRKGRSRAAKRAAGETSLEGRLVWVAFRIGDDGSRSWAEGRRGRRTLDGGGRGEKGERGVLSGTSEG